MKKFFLCIIGLLTYSLSFAQQENNDEVLAQRFSEKVAIEHLRKDIPRLMKEANVPGMSVALIRGGKMVWSGVFGVINNETKKPVTKQTIFEANSLSKPVFAYATLTLVDSGKLDLDKPVFKYMDSGFYANACADPRFKLVTARMILSNSSGIGYSSEHPDNKFTIEFNPVPSFSNCFANESPFSLSRITCKSENKR